MNDIDFINKYVDYLSFNFCIPKEHFIINGVLTEFGSMIVTFSLISLANRLIDSFNKKV